MYVSRRHVKVVAGNEHPFMAANQAQQASMRTMPGFRWALLLRSVADPTEFVSLAMCQTQEQAEALPGSRAPAATDAGGLAPEMAESQIYDVATACGSMTPCAFAAIVDWSVEDVDRTNFVNRWNAEFHRLEDTLGSRLLQHAAQPNLLAGLHVATKDGQLTPKTLAIDIKNSQGLARRPSAIDHFEVVLLCEP